MNTAVRALPQGREPLRRHVQTITLKPTVPANSPDGGSLTERIGILSSRRFSVRTPHIKPSMGTLLLAVIVMLSGLAVVYTTDLNRRLFMELQTTQNNQGQIRQEYGNLLLEQSTWSTEARVESLAQQRLEMSIPPTHRIIIIKQN